MSRIYACIDLKSFYASVECVERGLNPLETNLVVADENRTEKTVCLAVTPSLKEYGINGRSRLFEVNEKVREINTQRRYKATNNRFIGKSYNANELKKNKNLELDFIKAVPRMTYYMKYSTNIYNIYLKYLSKDDMYIYSVDEVFCDITDYLHTTGKTPKEFVTMMIKDVYETTGITATGGIGTNMYLAKIAMDIMAKHTEPNEYGVRIAILDEERYKKYLWNHKPITDFWRIGKGYAKKLEQNGMYTMGDVARCSIRNIEKLYKLFGINAEFLIDHAWGYEPCTIKDIKGFSPNTNSLSLGQVLHCPYNYEKTKIIIKEMADSLVLDLVYKKLVTNQIVLTVGYDIDNLKDKEIANNYFGEITIDRYGRNVPKHAHGTINLKEYTSSTKEIMQKAEELYEKIINKNLLTRRITLVANNVINERNVPKSNFEQIDLFINYEEQEKERKQEDIKKEKEKNLQIAVLDIKHKYGKNAVLKGMNFEEGGTMIERNRQVGGHRG